MLVSIFDDMECLTFEQSVDFQEPLRKSTRCDALLAILGHIPLFH